MSDGRLSWKIICTAMAIMASTLFVALLVIPGQVMWLFGLDTPPEAAFIARRAAMLFLGLAVLCWLSRSAAPSHLRGALALSLSVMMAALASLGIVEVLRGVAGPGIWFANLTELAFAVAFWRLR